MSQQLFLMIAVIILFVICGILSFYLLNRSEKIRKLSATLHHVKLSFNELDQQAKLIVKTDLELNKAQEELDKRLNGLDALHKISRLISTTLDENEIFQRINEPILAQLGFEKYLISTLDENKHLNYRVSSGFSDKEISTVQSHLEKNIPDLIRLLQKKQIISSVKKDIPEDYSLYAKIFKVRHFVLTPILTQKEVMGIVFAGNQSDAFPFTEGDEELISILSDQISQAVNNARLFEEVYLSRQKLELTVQERTKQLSSALDEVNKISKMKSEFISAVSHELRTPLTSIKGYAAILMTGKLGVIPDKVKERLEKINSHSDNLIKLINNLLDIARIESGQAEMKFTQSELPPMVEIIHDLLTPQLKEKNITFISQFEDNLPRVTMDTNQIERVFINLIGNAIKFTPEKGTIAVKIKADSKEATVSINDTGIGIKKEDVINLFNEFYRVENAINQNVKGSGLGLSLVKKIIEAHNGEIGLTSEVNKGTTFHFTIPIKHIEDIG